jgi:RHS repeat-associated protein
VGKIDEIYRHNAAGCITWMPGIGLLDWNFVGQLRSSVAQKLSAEGGGITPERTWYVYNWAGLRVRKVTERLTRQVSGPMKPQKAKETVCLATYELCRRYSGSGQMKSQKTTVRVLGDNAATPAALLEKDTRQPGSRSLVRYLIDEGLEADDVGRVVSFEEYSPYGATTYRAVSSQVEAPSKHRFAHYCRDEIGLNHCGARYYASWLGRWTSLDPLGLLDGPNLYAYVGNNPIDLADPTGTTKDRRESRGSGSEGALTAPAAPPGPSPSNLPAGTSAVTQPTPDQIKKASEQLDRAGKLSEEFWRYPQGKGEKEKNRLIAAIGRGMAALGVEWSREDEPSDKDMITWHTSLIWEYSQWKPDDAASKYEHLGHQLYQFWKGVNNHDRRQSRDFENVVISATDDNPMWKRITGEVEPCTRICTQAATHTTMFMSSSGDKGTRAEKKWEERQIELLKRKL